MSILNHLLHITNFKSPLLRTVVPSVGAALAIQFAAGLPSVLAGTERFFDFSGSLTFLAVGALSLYLPQLRSGVGNAALPKLFASSAWNWRQIALTGMAITWATRRMYPLSSLKDRKKTCSCRKWHTNIHAVGIYLFHRITQEGHDARFDKLRTQPLRFAFSFFMQAIWVSLMLMPVMAVNAVPAAALAAVPRVTVTDVLGIGVWAGGIALETAADIQKSRWVEGRRKKEHDEQFLKTGLFGLWYVFLPPLVERCCLLMRVVGFRITLAKFRCGLASQLPVRECWP